jgi:hypothetical protein
MAQQRSFFDLLESKVRSSGPGSLSYGLSRSPEEGVPAKDHRSLIADSFLARFLAWVTSGSRRIAKELRDRGSKVNRKRVQRLMREDNLLCVVKRRFVVTTDSSHGLKVYPIGRLRWSSPASISSG